MHRVLPVNTFARIESACTFRDGLLKQLFFEPEWALSQKPNHSIHLDSGAGSLAVFSISVIEKTALVFPNTLLDLQNSSYHTQPYSKIAR